MEKNINIKNKQFTCTIEGDPKNPAAIMIHDWASHRGVWKQTISAFKDRYYCIAVDLLGFGASDKPEREDYSLPTQCQRILSLAEQLGLWKFLLIGHSMGGQMAMYLAAVIIPERIEKLVTVNAIVTGKFSDKFEKFTPFLVKRFRKMQSIYSFGSPIVNSNIFAKYIFKNWFYNMSNYPFNAWESDRLAAFNLACAISYDETIKAIHALDLTQYLRKIKTQTLLIAGKHDDTVSMDQSLLAQTLIPNNDLAIIEKCGHYPMYEKTGNYLKALALIL